MIHRFTKKGLNFLLDVNSGAVHLLDDVSYAVSGLIDEQMTEACPDTIVQALPQYDAAAVREAYAELYALKQSGQLFADDDYIDVSKYIPTAHRSRRFACTSHMTATSDASTALLRPATLAPAARSCRLR